MTPDYYVSSLATPGVGDGTLGNPYALADLSIVGGTYKTVTAPAVVAVIADGGYALGTALSLPGGSTFNGACLRGCRVDGTFDDTRATKAQFVLTNSGTLRHGTYDTLADLHVLCQLVSRSTSPVLAGLYSTTYNVCVEADGVAVNAAAFENTSAMGAHYIACKSLGLFQRGFYSSRQSTFTYCLVDGPSGDGFYIYSTNASTCYFSHCVAANCAGAGFNMPGITPTLAHCLAISNRDGFVQIANASLIGCIAVDNIQYGFTANGYGPGQQHLLFGCCGYNNTSGLTNFTTNQPYPDGGVVLQNPDLDAYWAAQGAVPTVSQLLDGSTTGRNPAGPIFLGGGGGGGGGGPVPMIGSPFVRRA